MAPKYVLHYFNVTGRAEAIRLLFHSKGVEFEDKQYTFPEWAQNKSDESRFPLGQLPTLEIDGKLVCQSLAIIRHLANEFDLYGRNSEEKLLTDQIMETLNDVFNNASKIKFDMKLSEEEKKEAFAEYFEKSRKSFTFIMVLVKDTIGPFCFGSEIFLPDILLFSGYEFVNAVYPDILKSYPKLIALADAFKEHPNIKNYLTTRKHFGMK